MAKLLKQTDFVTYSAYAEYITQLHSLAVRCKPTGYCNTLDVLAIEAYSFLVDSGYFDEDEDEEDGFDRPYDICHATCFID